MRVQKKVFFSVIFFNDLHSFWPFSHRAGLSKERARWENRPKHKEILKYLKACLQAPILFSHFCCFFVLGVAAVPFRLLFGPLD